MKKPKLKSSVHKTEGTEGWDAFGGRPKPQLPSPEDSYCYPYKPTKPASTRVVKKKKPK
jgi:hypothetical protein